MSNNLDYVSNDSVLQMFTDRTTNCISKHYKGIYNAGRKEKSWLNRSKDTIYRLVNIHVLPAFSLQPIPSPIVPSTHTCPTVARGDLLDPYSGNTVSKWAD
jgi:hypothetical protein